MKMSRKRFKKLVMSRGFSRNEAEESCKIVEKCKASYYYTWIMYRFGFNI